MASRNFGRSALSKHPDEDAAWVAKIKEALSKEDRVGVIAQQETAVSIMSPSIFMAPAPLRGLKHQAFIPQVVPIGPYHCDVGPHHSSFPANRESQRYIHIAAQEMERHKIMASKYLAKSFKTEYSIFTLASTFLTMVNEIKQEYDSHLACNQTEERLAFMLALDASFVVEVLNCNAEEADLNVKRQVYAQNLSASAPHRPPRQAGWTWSIHARQNGNMQQAMQQEKVMESTLSSVRSNISFNAYYCNRFPLPLRKSILQDFVMLENQIPLLCLLKVVQMQRDCKTGTAEEAGNILGPLVVQIAAEVLPFQVDKDVMLKWMQEHDIQRCKHLLDCLYAILTHACAPPTKEDLVLNPTHFPRAVELYKNGISFQPLETESLIHVRFDAKKKTLYLPKVRVGDDTERLFRNLIAYESHMIDNVLVLSYLRFMNNLVNDEDDVALLIRKSILTEDLGSDLEVAHMWNNLCVNTMRVCNKSYEEVSQQLLSHCNYKINRWKGELKRTYFSRPWLVLSLFSGFSLLVMTLLIVIYTILLYNKPEDKPV